MDKRTIRRDLNVLENTPGVKQVIEKVLAYYDCRDSIEMKSTYYHMIIEEVVKEWKEELAKISPIQKGLFDETEEENKL